MKKITLLLCMCLAAWCVPQRVWADDFTTSNSAGTLIITVSGTTLTIESDAAGALSTFMDNVGVSDHVTAAQMATMQTCTKIVLKGKTNTDGKFNSNDLSKLAYDKSFTAVTEVDMSEAKFVRGFGSGTEYFLYKTDGDFPNNANIGTQAVVGGTLYQYRKERTWTKLESTPSDPITFYPTNEAMLAAKEYASINSYAKVPSTYLYCQMIISAESWTGETTTAPNGEVTPVTWYDYQRDSHLTEFSDGQVIKAKRYFKWETYTENEVEHKRWRQCMNDEDMAGLASSDEIIDGAAFNAPMNSLDAVNYGHAGSYIWFWIYYTKSETKGWSNCQNLEPGTTYTIGDFDSSEKESHKTYNRNEWVRMIDSYNYYRLDENSDAWNKIPYSNGDRVYNPTLTNDLSNISSPAQNPTAIVGGTTKVFDGSTWQNIGDVSELYDYSQMKFDYWKETLTTATTSNYANETISNGIFSGCTHLTSVNYMSGNVIGFDGHKSDYANFSITIGKNVTTISDNAFKECEALTTVTFDKTYPDPTTGYPKPLTIGEYAFMQCYHLTGIEIPNRVTSIGKRAFYRAGNTVEGLPVSSNGTFALSFERRNKLDAEPDKGITVSINYDAPLTIGEEAFKDCINIKDLSLPLRLESMGERAFENTFGLTKLVMRETTKSPYNGPRLTTIPNGAFHDSHVEEVIVPLSVTLIEADAFGSSTHLKSIRFQATDENGQQPLVIKEGAFSGGGESESAKLDVYVEIDPSKRKLICEYNAFNFTQMMQQTDVDNNHGATLHFDKAYWDYYQGNWKKGLAFKQENLNAFKDGYTDTDKGYMGLYSGSKANINQTTGKYEYGEVGPQDGQYTPGNGWQQFMGTDNGIEIVIPSGSFIRSYSSTKSYYIPIFEEGGKKQLFYQIYRVTDFSDGWTEGDDSNNRETANSRARIATATEVTETLGSGLNSRRYAPANTGLIMVGKGDAGQKYIIYQDEVEEGASITTYPYTNVTSAGQLINTSTANLLYPSCKTDESNAIPRNILDESEEHVVLYPTFPYPIQSTTAAGNFRIFGFKGAERKFYRSKPGVLIKRDMAYLMLPVSLFHWSNETGGTGSSGTGEDTSNITGSSRISLVFDDENDSETTGITMSSARLITNDAFYTLQGVKLSQPQGKGLYILNGKKVFVK